MAIQACNSIDSLAVDTGNIVLEATVCGEPLTLTAAYESEWDGNHLVLGPYHFCVDESGNLRINDGPPSAADDGVVVGDQS